MFLFIYICMYVYIYIMLSFCILLFPSCGQATCASKRWVCTCGAESAGFSGPASAGHRAFLAVAGANCLAPGPAGVRSDVEKCGTWITWITWDRGWARLVRLCQLWSYSVGLQDRKTVIVMDEQRAGSGIRWTLVTLVIICCCNKVV